MPQAQVNMVAKDISRREQKCGRREEAAAGRMRLATRFARWRAEGSGNHEAAAGRCS